jgi:hypothetical protein
LKLAAVASCFCRRTHRIFRPLEEAFSKLKTLLRQAGARNRQALQEAIATALDLITATDALGWLTHCGYLSNQCEAAEMI